MVLDTSNKHDKKASENESFARLNVFRRISSAAELVELEPFVFTCINYVSLHTSRSSCLVRRMRTQQGLVN